MKKNLLISLVLSFFGCWAGVSEANALEQDGEGVYQIANAQDLEDFSNLVASGNGSINAVLTADIDMTNVEHKPIGTTSSLFKGTFDGQEHYIMNMVMTMPSEDELPAGDPTESDYNYWGLFGVIGDGAYIKNLIIDWSCEIVGSAWVGAFAGGTNGDGTVTFENCGNEGTVGARYENAAGIIGVSMGGSCGIRLINCFNTGGISGARESAALCGWVGNNGSVIQNCYNTGFIIGMDGSNSLWRNGNGKGSNNYDSYGNQGTLISEDEYDLSCGSVCYQINGNSSENVVWYQRLGEDSHPVPFASHGIVYAVGDLYCDGTSKGGDLSFSNTDESNRDPHEFEDGICKNCGTPNPDFLQAVDGYYPLGSAVDLNWFASMVNKGYKKLNARLTADIDFSDYTMQNVMIGGDATALSEDAGEFCYEGIFDGQNHKITIAYNATFDGVGLFGVLENSTVRNLVVDGTIESTQRFIGGLGYTSRGTALYENIIVAVNITGSYSGDATNGGLFAVCHEVPTFRNCAFVGSMNCPESTGSAAIVGYAHGNVETTIENCYVAPSLLSLDFASGDGPSTIIARHVNNVVNCYYTENIDAFTDDAVSVPVTTLATGELCYKLNEGGANGAWRQNLPGDDYPVPFADHKMVYLSGALLCDGTPDPGKVVYSNEDGETTRPDHNYVDDICAACGARIIRNASQLLKLAEDVKTGVIDPEKSIIIDMVEDIDLKDIAYEGIGCRYSEDTGEVDVEQNPIMRDVIHAFNGTFDGHGHRVINMMIDSQDGNKGLFGVVKGGSTIKNVTVTGEIYSTGYSAGIVGTSTGKGTLTIENCGSEVDVNVGESANGGGILGVNDLSATYVRIINCYNIGNITGGRECGNISGWLGDRAEVINCYASGMVIGVDGNRTFARFNGNGATFTNCYEVWGMQEGIGYAELEDLENGKLCYLLNEGAGDTIFYQTLNTDDHPVLDPTHGIVYEDGEGGYTNDPSSAVKSVATAKTPAQATVFSLSGARQQQMQRGINIVRLSDGTVKKVLVK
jgi:hypothetical protein